MNTNEQAPDSCPFCGSEPLTEGEEKWSSEIGKYRCGTISHAFEPDDRWQTSQCRIAERERLTRERDEAKKAAQTAMVELGQVASSRRDLLSRVKQLESEWSGWPDLQREWFGDKYAAMQPIEAVRARIEDTEARVKRLEEAGDECSRHATGQARDDWNAAKEATP